MLRRVYPRTNFREAPTGEVVRRTHLPRTRVNKAKRETVCLGMRRAPDTAINMRTAVKHREGASIETVPFSGGKEEEVRTKIAMMIALGVVLVALVGSGPALAQVIGGAIQCEGTPCVATGAH